MGAALSRRGATGRDRRAARDAGVALDAAHLREFGSRLRAWYRRNARDLPWRRTRDPYRILVSELMLQQTQVSRVLGFYGRFLRRFPSLERLAAARPSQVREQWEGLGYYARARNLHKLSRWVTRDGSPHGGALPSEPAALRELRGIGAYTAGAVASFAHEKRAALVDTNVARVLSRVFAPHLQPKRARDLTVLWSIAERALPRTGAATWTHNQALMELGALVCTARVRYCAGCPVRAGCATYAEAPPVGVVADAVGSGAPVIGARGARAANRSRSRA